MCPSQTTDKKTPVIDRWALVRLGEFGLLNPAAGLTTAITMLLKGAAAVKQGRQGGVLLVLRQRDEPA